MSKGIQKLLTLFLVLMLIFTMVTSCAPVTQEPKPTPTPAETPEATPEPTPEPTPTEITYDFEGREIRITSWVKLEPEEGTPTGDRAVARRNDIEDKYNVKLKFIEMPDDNVHETLIASVLAGDPFTDICTIEGGWFYPGLVNNDYLYPLDTIDAFDFTEEKWSQEAVQGTTYEGHIYGMSVGKLYPGGMFYWNKDIFAKYGLPDADSIYDMVEAKEWTWDKLLEFARATTDDTDGDGVVDQYGLGALELLRNLIYSNGEEAVQIKDGKPVLTINSDAAIEAMNFAQNLAQVEKVFEIPPDGANWDYAAQQFQDGKTAMFGYSYWVTMNFKDNMSDDYGMIHWPMGPKSNDYVSYHFGVDRMVIPAGVKDVEQIAMVYNEWTEPYPEDGDDGWRVDYEGTVRDSRSLDTLIYLWDNNITKVDMLNAFPAAQGLWWGAEWEIIRGMKTPAQAMDEVGQAMQAALDDAVSQ